MAGVRAGAWTLALWLRLQEPRAITLVQTLIYLVLAWGGTTAVMQPPSSIEGQFGSVLTSIWAWCAIVGGLVGALACPFGKWMIEKPAIILCILASTLYAVFTLMLHVQGSGNRLPQLAMQVTALLYFASRYIRIHPFSYQPGK